MQKELLSVQEAAVFLGVSKSTIRRYISSGHLTAYRLGDERLIRIRYDDLRSLLRPIESKSSGDEHGNPTVVIGHDPGQ